MRSIVLAAALSVCLSACNIVGLGEQLDKLNSHVMFGGYINGATVSEAPVLLAAIDKRERTLYSYQLLQADRPQLEYFLMLPPGEYRVIAFQDTNGDLQHSDNELAGELGDGALVLTGPDQERYDLNIDLQPKPQVGGLDLSRASLSKRRPSTHIRLGEIVSLDDPAFTDEMASMGLWQPRRFMDQVTGGLYFLEPYSPDKRPVLFVHGALGHPANWRTVAQDLDRDHYQAWVFYYPTAAGLEDISLYMAGYIYELMVQLEFERLSIVGHSMGGLVAMRTTQILEKELGYYNPVDRVITLSTPWEGHKGAGWGAKFAPAAAPSWLDMAPDSEFIEALTSRHLPEHIPHSLLFSYKGGNSLGEKADGAVTLTSQLAPPFQLRAEYVFGFDETHTSILESQLPVQTLHTLLE